MKILVINISDTNVKVLLSGQETPEIIPSGPTLTPTQMIFGIRRMGANCNYDVVSIGYPGLVLGGHVVAEPHSLGRGWVGFDFEAAFKRPVKISNHSEMEALGAYRGGRMLFLGLGVVMSSLLVVNGRVVPMKLGHLPYRKGTFDDYLGIAGIQRLGKKKWGRHVGFGVACLIAAMHPDDLVLGGCNCKKLKQLPVGCRAAHDTAALLGGVRLWENAADKRIPIHAGYIPDYQTKQKVNGNGTAHPINFETAH